MYSGCFLGLLVFTAAAQAAANGRSHSGSRDSIYNFKDKIRNVVLLVMENRSLDNLLGGQTLKGFENPIQNGPYCNPYDLNDPSKGIVCSAAKDYDEVADDPNHSVTGNNLEFYGTYTPDNEAIANGSLTPSMNGFVHEQISLYSSDANRTELATQVMNYYTEEQVPVLTALVNNFVVFNHWHSGIPGPTNPNRAAIVSGTSCGHGTNDDAFPNHSLPEISIFQTLTESGIDWLNYWDTLGGTGPDSQDFQWIYENGLDNRTVDLENFYRDATAGNLTDFSYINPSCCGVGTSSMHPSGLVSDGEELIRNVYNALVAGTQWNQTLFILTFDESGGFHDHVPPPLAPRPDNLTYTETAANGESYTYPFNRLGGRIPSFLISPWVDKAHVEQQGTNSANKKVSYHSSSILRTLGYLWDFEPYNPRIQSAPTFDHLIRTVIRNDIPSSLPNGAAF